MDFRAICALFNGTIFYDDLRGNLTTIEAKLQQPGHTALESAGDEAAASLLARAIFSIHVGDFASAVRSLDLLANEADYGRRWRLRSNAYYALLALHRERPPLLGSCDLDGPAMIIWKGRKHKDNALWSSFMKRCFEDRDAGTELDILEMDIIHFVCMVRGTGTDKARLLNPRCEYFTSNENERRTYQGLMEIILRQVDDLRRRCVQADLPLIASYILRLTYELCDISCYHESALILEYLRHEYEKDADDVGLGVYWMFRGDRRVSPCNSSPLVFNWDIAEHLDEFNGESSMKPARDIPLVIPSRLDHADMHGEIDAHLRFLPDVVKSAIYERLEDFLTHAETLPDTGLHDDLNECYRSALACYSQAQRHFRKAESIRGQSLATLKESCTIYMAECSPPEEMRTYNRVQARARVDECLSLSRLSGDTQLEQFATGLFLMHSDEDLKARESAHSLAQWTIDSDNEVLGLSIVLTLFRAANFYRYLCGTYRHAWAVSEHARRLIRNMSAFRSVYMQVMLFQVSMYKSHGQYKAALLWLDFMKEALPLIIVRETPALLASGPDPEWNRGMTLISSIIQNIVDYVVALIPNMAASYKDPMTVAMLEMVRGKCQYGHIQDWSSQMATSIQYTESLPSPVRYSREKHDPTSREALRAFLNDPVVMQSNTLQTKSLRINALSAIGDKASARVILDDIKDSDELSQFYLGVGRGNSIDEHRSNLRLRTKSLETVLLLCIKCCDWSRAKRLLNLLESTSPGYFTSVSSYTKLWPWHRFLYAGLIYEHDRQFNLAGQYFLRSYAYFLPLSSKFRGTQGRDFWELPIVARLMNALVRQQLCRQQNQLDISQVPPVTEDRFNHEAIMVFDHEIDHGEVTHLHMALMLLERGRSAYLRESALRKVPTEIRELIYKHQTWNELRSKPQAERTVEEQAEFEFLDPVIPDIGDRINSEDLSFDDSHFVELEELYASIPRSSIVIYTALSEDGLIVLCVDHTGVKVGFLNDKVNPTMITEYMHTLHFAISDVQNLEERSLETFQATVQHLSQLLIPPPVERCIAARSNVIFIPSGNLALLPFGVLLYKGKHLHFEREVSQVPSLSTLHNLLGRDVPKDSARIRVLARPGHPRDPHGHLPMSGIEALCIASLVNATPIDAKNVTRADFQQYLREVNILHVSTHGINDPAFPYNSHILLQEPFRVLDMMAVQTEIALVTFSACLSNLGTGSEAGDIRGFSHSILAAGAKAFIGALWKVNDVVTMIQMNLFYQLLFIHRAHRTISEAWKHANFILYHANTDQIVSVVELMIYTWDSLERRGRNPNGFVRNGRKKLESVVQRYRSGNIPQEWDFKHPKNWAAFVLVGNGFQRWRLRDEKDIGVESEADASKYDQPSISSAGEPESAKG